jgi:hypoxanthine phosphoribosyltransferase
MKIRLFIIFIILSYILTSCADYRQRNSARRSIDSAENLGRRVENMSRYNYDTYSKIDNFFYILDDLYDTTHYAKESLKYSSNTISQNKIKAISAYFTANDPYPNNKKDINYCENVSNFFTKVIELKNQNIPENRVKVMIQNEYNIKENPNIDEVFYKKRLEIANIAINKIYQSVGKTDPSAAKSAFKQGCLEVDLK